MLAFKVMCLRVRICLVSINMGDMQTETDSASQTAGAWRVCVSLHCLPQRPTVRVKEIVHLASISCSALFISHSTNISYLLHWSPSTLFPCSTLKPDFNTHRLLNSPHPSRLFPFGTLLHRNTPDQQFITTTPQLRIEAHWLRNKALLGPRHVTPTSASHLRLLGYSVCRSVKGGCVRGRYGAVVFKSSSQNHCCLLIFLPALLPFFLPFPLSDIVSYLLLSFSFSRCDHICSKHEQELTNNRILRFQDLPSETSFVVC